MFHVLCGHRGEVYALDLSADGKTLLSASRDRTVRIWDVTRLSEDSSEIIEKSCRVLKINESKTSDVAFTSASISHDSRYVAAGSLDGIIRVWDLTAFPEDADELEGAKLVDRLRGHGKSVYSVKFVPGLSTQRSREALVSGSLDMTLKRWEIGAYDDDDVRGTGRGDNGGTCIKTFRGHKVIHDRSEFELSVLTF